MRREGGGEDAQYRLGDAHRHGDLGLEIDLEAALTWFQKTAKGGRHYAKWRLGWAYEKGDLGVKIDLEVARTWYQEAAGVATDFINGS